MKALLCRDRSAFRAPPPVTGPFSPLPPENALHAGTLVGPADLHTRTSRPHRNESGKCLQVNLSERAREDKSKKITRTDRERLALPNDHHEEVALKGRHITSRKDTSPGGY